MPPVVKKTMSVTILTSIFTFLGITILTIFGQTSVKAHDTEQAVLVLQDTVDDTKNTVDGINTQMGELFKFQYETLNIVKTNSLIITHCKDDIKDCEDDIKTLEGKQ